MKAYFYLCETNDTCADVRALAYVHASANAFNDESADIERDDCAVLLDVGDLCDCSLMRIDSAEFDKLEFDGVENVANEIARLREIATRHSAEFVAYAQYRGKRFWNRVMFVER